MLWQTGDIRASECEACGYGLLSEFLPWLADDTFIALEKSGNILIDVFLILRFGEIESKLGTMHNVDTFIAFEKSGNTLIDIFFFF